MYYRWLLFVKSALQFLPGKEALLFYCLSSVVTRGCVLHIKIYVRQKYDPEYSIMYNPNTLKC